MTNIVKTQFDLIVVGAGPGGYVAAIRAAQLGLSTAIVEANHLGGICLNWGCIPTKALLRSAQLYQQISEADQFGITVEGVSFDLTQIVARSRQVSQKLSGGIGHLLAKNKVTVIDGYGKLQGMNDHQQQQLMVEQANGQTLTLTAPRIIMATGARARTFAGLEADGDRVWSYREALVPKQIPASILVIGSGAIGIEFANFYHALGAQVTVVEVLEQILPLEDQEIAQLAQHAMQKRGIQFKLATKVMQLERQPDQVIASLEHHGKTEQLVVAQVITAVGVSPNVENLGLEAAGVQLSDAGFIAVDHFCQTTANGIYAIGDVAGAPCLAHKASHEAIICVEHFTANQQGHTGHGLDKSMIASCTYGFPQVASVGITEKQAKAQGIAVNIGRFPFQANGKALAQGETDGMVKVIFAQKTGELLGAHMVGSEVTELIQGFVVAKTMEATEETLFDIVFPHPTLSEAMHESVLDAYGRAIHI